MNLVVNKSQLKKSFNLILLNNIHFQLKTNFFLVILSPKSRITVKTIEHLSPASKVMELIFCLIQSSQFVEM